MGGVDDFVAWETMLLLGVIFYQHNKAQDNAIKIEKKVIRRSFLENKDSCKKWCMERLS